jgi:hypothetical protein
MIHEGTYSTLRDLLVETLGENGSAERSHSGKFEETHGVGLRVGLRVGSQSIASDVYRDPSAKEALSITTLVQPAGASQRRRSCTWLAFQDIDTIVCCALSS